MKNRRIIRTGYFTVLLDKEGKRNRVEVNFAAPCTGYAGSAQMLYDMAAQLMEVYAYAQAADEEAKTAWHFPVYSI